MEDISKLLEISFETYFKTIDGKVYMVCRLENPYQNLWREYICTGLKKNMCSMRTAVSRETLFSEKDRWMMCFLCEGKKGGFRTLCLDVKRERE